MKNFIIFLVIFFSVMSAAAAVDNETVIREVSCQQRIEKVGINLLNSNKIQKRIVFTYNKNAYGKTLNDPTITKRQIIFYEDYFKYVKNDDELAAFLSREISRAVQSYSGELGGFVSSAQIKAAPKKYEIFADKRAVDYMVKAGYNPLGLITFVNKSAPQGIFDKLLFHNSTSKRLATIYEYIYFNYPEYLENNKYINDTEYQNFLLNSVDNRRMLEEKIKNKSTKELKYE